MAERILLVEDEAGLLVTLEDRLHSAGYDVDAVADGREGLDCALKKELDLIVLDIMLPSMDGVEVCRELRSRGMSTPVLMLTAKAQLENKLDAFEQGADDYLTKPFDVAELLARVKALLRRRTEPIAGKPTLEFGRNCLDTHLTEVRRDGVRLPLSVKEFNLLHYFLKHPGETLSREVLLRDVWRYPEPHVTRTVDVHIGWLRQKIEDNPKKPRWIRTVHGRGYRFVPEQ